MGQYYKAVNLDRAEQIKPGDFNCGAKFLELTFSSHGILMGLAAMLIHDNQQRGAWAGNQIVLEGDYDTPGKFVDSDKNLYQLTQPWKSADIKGQLKGLGESLEAFDDDEEPEWPEFLEANRVFTCPEDIIEVAGISVTADLRMCFSSILRRLRWARVETPLNNRQVRDVELTLTEDGMNIQDVRLVTEGFSGTSVRRSKLSFPATGADVQCWLEVTLPTPRLLSK